MARMKPRVMPLLFGTLVAVGGCSKSEAPAPPPATGAMKPAKDPAAAKKLIAAGAVVLDVRTPDEFAGGHVPSATNIPVDQVTQRLAEVDKLVGSDKTKPVVVYCAAGSRAAKAEVELEAAGYTQVVNGGGLDDLQ
jgi:rhodanese-related sulfurtransferase